MMDVFLPGAVTVTGPQRTIDVVDSTGTSYGRNAQGDIIVPRQRRQDESSTEYPSDVVTSANGLTGAVRWIGGDGIRVTTHGDHIKITADSEAEDESPDDSKDGSDCCKHPGDEDNTGGVSPGDDGGSGGGGGGGGGGVGGVGGGGVSAGDDAAHEGDNECCGPGS